MYNNTPQKTLHAITYPCHNPDAGFCTFKLTHWGRVMHICVVNLIIIGSDNGLSPERRQAIIWTNAGIVSIEPLGTNFSEILIGIKIFSFKKMRLKMSSGKWRPFRLGLNVLNHVSKGSPAVVWKSRTNGVQYRVLSLWIEERVFSTPGPLSNICIHHDDVMT